MGLTEREKIIYIISKVRAQMEVEIIQNRDSKKAIIAAGKQITFEMFRELGLRYEEEIYNETVKFDHELDIISDILNKEDGLMQ